MFFYIILGILPSIIWLSFFLKEDVHPESNQMILKVFLYGLIAASVAIIAGAAIRLSPLHSFFNNSSWISIALKYFLAVAFIEELSKYIVVRKIAISDPEFDEPLDAMLYMVIAGLGFAAIENIFYLIGEAQPVINTLILTTLRFVGATFLHALCGGIIGFFLAFSFFENKNKTLLIIAGIALAVSLHGVFDISIIKLRGATQISFPSFLLLGMGMFVFWGFQKLKTIASICKLK
ncbi:PrsW family intramembrane metalloprotease [bacterium]|nr:PrsW family intramembrane metalloprotease [bacterium]